jgi:hypothetical protein
MTIPFAKKAPAPRHLFRGEWKTVREIAEITGIKKRTVNRRIQLGLPIEGPARMGPKPRTFLFRGKKKTIADIMVATGLSRSQVSKRTDGKRFFEKWELTDPYAPLPDSARSIFFKGITDSVSGWARRTGIPRHVIRDRLAEGWSLKRALTEPAMRGGQRIIFNHNRRCITRIAVSFRSPKNTPRYPTTFTPPTGTGAHPLEFEFEGSSA